MNHMTASRKTITAFIISALVLLLAVGLLSHQAIAGFTASINNNTNTVGTGTSFYTAKNATPTTDCTSVPTGTTIPATSTFPCTGSLLPAVPATGNSTDNETLTASGTAPFTSAKIAAASCGPVQFANLATTTNPMIVRGGITFNQAGPLTGSNSAQFNGTDSSAAGVVSYTGLQTFTAGIWFNTTVAGGAMFGWSTSGSNVSPSQYDRMMYLTSAGKVAFATYNNGSHIITSTNSYNDGKWHYAAVVVNAATSSTLNLYVDGVSASTTLTVASTTPAETSSGFWRVGQARSTTADGYTGTNQFFSGLLSDFHVQTTAYTAANIATLYASANQTAFTNNLNTIGGAKEYLPLNDTGLTTYTGTLPVMGTTSPCTTIRVTIGTATSCIYPASTAVCAAPAAAQTLSTLASAGPLTFPVIAPGATQTLTYTLTRDTTYNTNYEVGLRLLLPTTITQNGFTQTFTWANNTTII